MAITDDANAISGKLGYTKELYEQRKKSSRALLVAAWLLEIVAASIGAFIAYLTIVAALDVIAPESMTRSIQLNAFLGGLPFLMVAIVELMKIPLVTAAFHSKSSGWKLFFTVSLILVALITFETALNGFQRNFQTRMRQVDGVKNEIVTLEATVALLEQERVDIENIDSTNLYERQNQLTLQANSEIESINLNSEADSNEALSQYGGGSLTSNQNRLDDINEELNQLVVRRESELARIQEQYEADIQSESDRYQIATEGADVRYQRLQVDRDSAIEACPSLLGRRPCIDAAQLEFAEREEALSAEGLREEHSIYVSEINSRRDQDVGAADQDFESENERLRIERVELTGQISTQSNEDRDTLNTVLARINANKETEISRVREKLALDTSQISNQLQAQTTRQDQLNTTINEIDAANNELIDRRREFDSVANQDQIYQIAKLVFDARSASEITEDQIRLVVFIWFGSLAAIVACTGIVLALGSMVLRYEPMQSHTSLWAQIGRILFYIFDFLRYLPRTVRSIRSLVVTYRKRLEKTPKTIEKKVVVKEVEYVEKVVEVVKEVPVEKVVIKKVEVPVSVTKKEFVYVPFYSTDMEDIEKLKKQLDKEVS